MAELIKKAKRTILCFFRWLFHGPLFIIIFLWEILYELFFVEFNQRQLRLVKEESWSSTPNAQAGAQDALDFEDLLEDDNEESENFFKDAVESRDDDMALSLTPSKSANVLRDSSSDLVRSVGTSDESLFSETKRVEAMYLLAPPSIRKLERARAAQGLSNIPVRQPFIQFMKKDHDDLTSDESN